VFFAEHTAAELLGQLMHFLEYTVLALLLMRALTITLPTSSKINLITIVFSILYAFSDELHQLLVPGRSFQLIDLLIDFLGIITGTFLFNKIMKKR
jgi:VanZ family protein